jgi:hypothetical protein
MNDLIGDDVIGTLPHGDGWCGKRVSDTLDGADNRCQIKQTIDDQY